MASFKILTGISPSFEAFLLGKHWYILLRYCLDETNGNGW